MIGIEISGGLGNQFFRYAWGRTLLERRRAEGLADTVAINYNGVDDHGFAGSLRDFQIVEHEAPTCQRLLLRYGSLPQKAAFAAFKLLGRVCRGDGYKDFRRRTLARMGVLTSESPDNELLITPPEK